MTSRRMRVNVADRAIEFDGKIIGYTRIVDGGMYAYTSNNVASGVFDSCEAAVAWLTEQYAKAQEGE
jgi:hypothetical protein